METSYEVIIADDSNHEEVFAEIYHDRKFLALISQENGKDHLKVELPGLGLDESQIVREVTLTEFIAVLEKAAKKLVGGNG